MKKNLRILMIILFTMFLLVSFRSNKDIDGLISLNTNILLKTDTLTIKHWIKVDSFSLSILPPSSGIQFYREGIVFLSSSKQDKKMLENHISFGKSDTKYAVLNDNKLENSKPFSPNKAFTFPSEAITFSSGFDTMYYTRYSPPDGVEKIYRAIYNSGEGKEGFWSLDDNPMSFCSGKSVYSHPSLSADGKIMIFASNRPGAIGGMDLYVTLQKGGTWSVPLNLGEAINSTANEIYPFLDSENNLFFSSDGAQGYGGYDIYVCKFKGNTWEKPVNLSSPINTRSDDVAFTINRKDGKSGFYTVKHSTRKSPQLYIVRLHNLNQDSIQTLSQFLTRPNLSQMVILALEPAVQATNKASVTATKSYGEKDIITFRVQFLTSFNPRTRSQITVDGKDYSVFEYLFSGAYRLYVGEFGSLSEAIELQNILKANNYPQATVAAFKNNVLSLDPELLRETISINTKTEQKIASETIIVAKSPEKVPEVLNKVKTESEIKKDQVTKETVPPEQKKNEISPVPVPEPSVKKDVVVYRVQIITNNTPKGSYKINIGDKTYNTFEYIYSGAYRTCVGEFSTLSTAKDFQNSCRQSGYPQAFVVVFKNNTRSTDPALFK